MSTVSSIEELAPIRVFCRVTMTSRCGWRRDRTSCTCVQDHGSRGADGGVGHETSDCGVRPESRGQLMDRIGRAQLLGGLRTGTVLTMCPTCSYLTQRLGFALRHLLNDVASVDRGRCGRHPSCLLALALLASINGGDGADDLIGDSSLSSRRRAALTM